MKLMDVLPQHGAYPLPQRKEVVATSALPYLHVSKIYEWKIIVSCRLPAVEPKLGMWPERHLININEWQNEERTAMG